jgi:flagellar motor switch protein FliM
MVYERARGPAVSQEGIGKQLLKSKVFLELATPGIPVRLMDLLSLQPGTILGLHRNADEPALVRMRGREWWSARPVSSRTMRAAQLLQHLPQEEAQP